MLWEERRAEKGGGLSSRGKDWKLKDLEKMKGRGYYKTPSHTMIA
jgi:hypothetical protein